MSIVSFNLFSKGKIKKVLGGSSLSSSAVMVLVNAVYFKGKWKSAFTKSETLNCRFRSPTVSTYPPKLFLCENCGICTNFLCIAQCGKIPLLRPRSGIIVLGKTQCYWTPHCLKWLSQTIYKIHFNHSVFYVKCREIVANRFKFKC